MTGFAVAALLGDGRLHLQHGPIDLIIEAKGSAENVAVAYQSMTKRFSSVLDELVPELNTLRREVSTIQNVAGAIARRMLNATRKFGDTFVTPMAAVAGSVADEIADNGWMAIPLRKLCVNNGGDIAFRVSRGEDVAVGVAKSVLDKELIGRLHFTSESSVRGVATSGFGGRSHTFGIADAVTVVSSCAADADVAATLIANQVSLVDHPEVKLVAANSIDSSSDLGDRLITASVGELSDADIEMALDNGMRTAKKLISESEIEGVFIALRGRVRSIGKFDYK